MSNETYADCICDSYMHYFFATYDSPKREQVVLQCFDDAENLGIPELEKLAFDMFVRIEDEKSRRRIYDQILSRNRERKCTTDSEETARFSLDWNKIEKLQNESHNDIPDVSQGQETTPAKEYVKRQQQKGKLAEQEEEELDYKHSKNQDSEQLPIHENTPYKTPKRRDGCMQSPISKSTVKDYPVDVYEVFIKKKKGDKTQNKGEKIPEHLWPYVEWKKYWKTETAK
jgi:hypothetical protein